jgi:hypothetical protein
MVVNDLNTVCVTLDPLEDHTPLIVDANRVVPLQISVQLLEPAGRTICMVLTRQAGHLTTGGHGCFCCAAAAISPRLRKMAAQAPGGGDAP